MKKIFNFVLVILLFTVLAVSAKVVKETQNPGQYSINVTIKDIPKGEQTLFIPIMIDTMVFDFDKVALEGLATQNILAVASTSKDKVGTGIGLLKLDENGLPDTLTLKVLLKPQGEAGQTAISLLMMAPEAESVLPSRGAQLDPDIQVSLDLDSEITVNEKTENNKRKLILNKSRLTLSIQRSAQKEETIYIPIVLDKNIVDLDETFGHSIVAPGIAVKSISANSLQEGGPGVEILLTEAADKDFSVDIDLVPRKAGASQFIAGFPQKGKTPLIRGPIVEINPSVISVISNK